MYVEEIIMKGSQVVTQTDVAEIEQESSTPSVSVDMDAVTDGDGAGGRGGMIEGALELQQTLDELTDGLTPSGFKCAHEECGLVHGHATNKHRATDSFDVSADEASSMETNPNCHCGLHESAERGFEGAPSRSGATEQAPIPSEMGSHIDASF